MVVQKLLAGDTPSRLSMIQVILVVEADLEKAKAKVPFLCLSLTHFFPMNITSKHGQKPPKAAGSTLFSPS